MKCWDAKSDNRPTAKELYQILRKLFKEHNKDDSEIYSQMRECEKIRENNKSNKKDPEDIQTHPQAIYTSRLLNFKNLPELNSGNVQTDML